MQQRLNNRWLSQRLLEASANESRAGRSAGTSRRRVWQHIATATLLLGSLAFSYLAWSKSLSSLPWQGVETRSGQMEQTENLALRSDPEHKATVNALRARNRELHQQIAALKALR